MDSQKIITVGSSLEGAENYKYWPKSDEFP